jgi:hypothetical protein
MPVTKKTDEATAPETPAVCDNHPDRPAVHTTSAVLHQAISLCRDCLARAEHLLGR